MFLIFTGFHTHTGDSHPKIFAGWKPLFIDTLLRPKDALAAGIVCLLLDLIILAWFITWLGPGILCLAAIGAAVALTGEYALRPVVVSIPIGFFITVVAYLKGAHYKTKGEGADYSLLIMIMTGAIIAGSIMLTG